MINYKDSNGNVHSITEYQKDLVKTDWVEMTAAEWELYMNPPKTDYELAAERAADIHTRLSEIDVESVRPLRAVTAGTATAFDTDKLAALDTEAEALRLELASL